MRDHDSINLDSIRDALGLSSRHAPAGRSWFDNWMRGGPFPPSGPGGFPELDDLRRAVSLVLDGDEPQRGYAMTAVAAIALGPYIPGAPVSINPLLTMVDSWRAEVDRLGADDLAAIQTIIEVVTEGRRDPEVREAILDAIEARRVPTGGAR